MPLLTRHLRQHGYKTVTFSTFADRHQAFWFHGGWSESHTPSLKTGDENADEVNEAVLPWLKNHGQDDNWFLHVQYWDPHRNYTVDQKWIDLIADDPFPAWPDEAAIARHQAAYGPFTATELFPHRDGKSPVETMPHQITCRQEFKHFVDGYDGAIRFMDDQIGQLISLLDQLGILDDTAIVISADHGEAMGEQGVYGDHVCAGEAVHNVPMIVRWPGNNVANRQFDDLVYNVDFHPTLCNLLDIPVPSGWDGESFAAAIRGEDWSGRDYLVWDHALYSCQRAVRTPDWLFIRTYHPGLFSFAEQMLFDMENDPHQASNLAMERPDICAQMDYLMQNWLHDQVGHHGSQPDPLAEVVKTGPFKYVQLEPWISRLHGKGRSREADEILNRLGLGADLKTLMGYPPV
jgi:arylsulfatase A-like enzyme